MRDREIARLYIEGAGLRKVGAVFGLSVYRARKILVEQGVVIRKPKRTMYHVDARTFDTINSELSAYWLGFIYADGCVSKQDALRICIHRKDKQHLEKIKPFLKTKRPLLDVSREGQPQVLFKVVEHHMAKRLRELGILVDRPSFDLAINSVPRELMHHFIRGYFDGDGSTRKKRVTIRFCGQRDLLEWMKEYFKRELGAECGRKIQAYNHTDKICLLEFSPCDSRMIRDYMYGDATVWLERKRQIAESWK